MDKYSIFNADFYPTPPDLIGDMLDGEVITGKVFLEPSAGMGSIVTVLKNHGAKSVIACEKDQELAKILQTECKIVASDFFTLRREDVSHVDHIVMNPPFSNAERHISHAYQIAPDGCKITALCNTETVKNAYSRGREELKTLIETYGNVRNLGERFTNSLRKTAVEVSLIKLLKPGKQTNEFEGFFMDEDPESQANGVIPYNVVRDLVNRYVGAMKIYDEQLETAVRLNDLMDGYFCPKEPELSISVTRLSVPLKRNEFKKEMQKSGWHFVFQKMNMKKHSTEGLKADINKFVETQENIPFTMRNIYKMLEIVIGTQGARMDRALLEVFDRVTRHTHENQYNVEGWQTNSHYLLTRRFILPYVTEIGWSGQMEVQYRSGDMIEDIQKALCYLTGQNYDEKKPMRDFLTKESKFGEWYEWNFFRIKGYKKGTMHFEFMDEKVWIQFNQRIAKLKGYPLPEFRKQTKWQEQRNGHQEPQPMTTKNGSKNVQIVIF